MVSNTMLAVVELEAAVELDLGLLVPSAAAVRQAAVEVMVNMGKIAPLVLVKP